MTPKIFHNTIKEVAIVDRSPPTLLANQSNFDAEYAYNYIYNYTQSKTSVHLSLISTAIIWALQGWLHSNQLFFYPTQNIQPPIAQRHQSTNY